MIKKNQPMILMLLLFLMLAACSEGPLPSPSEPKTESISKLQKETPTDPVHLESFWVIDQDSEFRNPVSIASHPKGSLILDMDARRVFCLSDDNELLFEFGTRGFGPGEFEKPLRISCARDAIFVFDLSGFRLSRFDLEGKFLSQQVLPQPVAHMFCLEDRMYLATFHEEGKPDIKILDNDGNSLHEIQLRNADLHTYYTALTLGPDQKIYAAAINHYQIEVYSRDGEFLQQFGRPYEAKPYYLDPYFNLEISHLPIAGLSATSKNLFVLYGDHQDVFERLSGSQLVDEYATRIDIFDNKGQFIANTWPEGLGRRMTGIHNAALFHAEESGKLWLVDPADTAMVYQFRVRNLPE